MIHQQATNDRYASLAISEAWNLEEIRSAKAMVVGCGALGNEVAKNLAMMGVDLIVLVDGDSVERSNLTRSVFFRESHAKQNERKVDCLARGIKELNEEVTVVRLHGEFNQVVGLGLLRQMDMVFSCLDSRVARSDVNLACQKIGQPWVDGAMENLIGDVTPHHPDHGPCYWCGLSNQQKLEINRKKSCNDVVLENIIEGRMPTTSTMGSIIAAVQVQEAIKIFQSEFDIEKFGSRLVFNCIANDFYSAKPMRDDKCIMHARYDEPVSVPEFSVSTSTPRDVMDRICPESAWIRLNHPVHLSVTCKESGHSIIFDSARQQVKESHLKEFRRTINETYGMDVAHASTIVEGDGTSVREFSLSLQGTDKIERGDSFADIPLAKLGIAAWDILQVFSNQPVSFVELSGDQSLIGGLLPTQKPR